MSQLNRLNKGKNKEAQEDPMAKMIKNNPCGLCKTMGLPICKGHGGGGGGSG